MGKISIIGKIAGKFTYHKADQELRPPTLQNKDPFRKSYNTVFIIAVGAFLVGLILPEGYWSTVIQYSGVALALLWIFAVIAQFGTNRGNDEHWAMQLREKHKNNHLFH